MTLSFFQGATDKTFLPRSKCLLISWLQSPSAVILETQKIKYVTVSIASPSISHEMMGPDAMIFVFWMFNFKFSSFTFFKRFVSSSLGGCGAIFSLTIACLLNCWFLLWIWNRLLLERVIFVVIFSLFHHFKCMLPHPSGLRVSVEMSAVRLMGITLHIICYFPWCF